MATTIEYPLELDIVDPTNSNAFWTRQDNQSGYGGVFRFSGDSYPHAKMVFIGTVPPNVAATPAWNIVLHHAIQTAAGNVLLRAEATVVGSGDTPGPRTVIVPNVLYGVDASGDHNRTVMSGSDFDVLLPLGAGKMLRVELMRCPNQASGDTAGKHWDLLLPPLLRVDVT